MSELREQHHAGLDCLVAATELLQRVRGAHPTAGLYEAADLQWWWRVSRPRTAEAGAKRIKICYDPDNQAAERLYLSAGFKPHRHTALFTGRTSKGASR